MSLDNYMSTVESLHVSYDIGQFNVSSGFLHGYISSFSMVGVSEIGDKTFLIAVIMSMKYSRLAVLTGAVLALALMTLLSALSGWLVTSVPTAVIRYSSAALFAWFGLGQLKEGWTTASGTEDSLREVETQLRVKLEDGDPESGVLYQTGGASYLRVFLEAFGMTLLAEMGDRSQVATFLLAAREDFLGVVSGAIVGHAMCTSLAVIGGKFIAKQISIRTVTIIGGFVFLTFAVLALLA